MKIVDRIEQWPLDKLIPYAKNSRTHSEEQIAQIAGSIKAFGFTNPILVGGDGVIVAGHGRLSAARQLGLKQVPVIVLDHLSETERRALVIADNKLALNAEWDKELLLIEIEELQNNGFTIESLGFDASELVNEDIDYSILDGEDVSDEIDAMASGVKKAIQIEFDPEHYEEAQELIKWWRNQGANIGYMILNFLKIEKQKT
jgi:ParB-like chromosome segregation protein Spo0J